MSGYKLTTPVVLTVFNRPDTLSKVFEQIRQAKPPKLFVIADAPRKNRMDEEEKCSQSLAIIDQVDWECQVFKNYSNENLGPKKRITSGLNWVFDIVEEAIILEHDCLPHPTFFRFCQEMLKKYKDDMRITTISGSNFQKGKNRKIDSSYYFAHFPHGWGWATWRRVWRNHDVAMPNWPKIRDGGWLRDIVGSSKNVNYWTRIFQDTFEGKIDTWDYQFLFNCLMQNGLGVVSNVNLVSNIGFGIGATNTLNANDPFAAELLGEMKFPLVHPNFVIANAVADNNTMKQYLASQSLIKRIKAKFMKHLLKI